MGLCINDAPKKKKEFKTIIIPKGVINPNANNVIEIPNSLRDTNSSLVVKGPTESNPYFTVEPYYEDAVSQRPSALPRQMLQTMVANIGSNAPTRSGLAYATIDQSSASGSARKADFACQTCLPQPEYLAPAVPSTSQAHSPFCPICARASCKFNFSSRLPKLDDGTFGLRSHSDQYSTPGYLPNVRSELFRPALPSLEKDLLNKMLDEKIDRIIKPLLYQLARDDEREISSQKFSPRQESARTSTCDSRSRCSNKTFDTDMDYHDFRTTMRSKNYGFEPDNGRLNTRITFNDSAQRPNYDFGFEQRRKNFDYNERHRVNKKDSSWKTFLPTPSFLRNSSERSGKDTSYGGYLLDRNSSSDTAIQESTNTSKR